MAKSENSDRMVVIPRKVYPQHASKPWDELVATAEAGTDGVKFYDGSEGFALMRGAQPSEKSLIGKSLLYFQAWF